VTESELIRQYLKERQPQLAAAADLVALSGDASTRRYYRLLSPGTSYVLALYPEPFTDFPRRTRRARRKA
jgi:hypothetical protein